MTRSQPSESPPATISPPRAFFPCAPPPQCVPDVRCRGSAALERLLWLFFVNLSPPLSDRGDRPALSPASNSQFRLPSAHRRDSCACSTAPPSGMKIRAQGCPVPNSKFPDRQSLRRTEAGSNSPPLRRSSKTLRAPDSPAPRAPSIAPAQFPVPADRDPSPPNAPSSAARRSQWHARLCQQWHPDTCPRAESAASPQLTSAGPVYAERSKARCPDLPVPFRLPP